MTPVFFSVVCNVAVGFGCLHTPVRSHERPRNQPAPDRAFAEEFHPPLQRDTPVGPQQLRGGRERRRTPSAFRAGARAESSRAPPAPSSENPAAVPGAALTEGNAPWSA